jgi:hypothetical protein
MPQLPVIFPRAILDFGEEHRLNEDGAFPSRGHGRRFRRHSLEQFPQLSQKLI